MREIKSILLVDDDKDDQYFFYKAMEEVNPNINLMAASDGNDAFDKLRFVRPDLILLDLVMPGMNGIAFLKKIKSDKQLKRLPVVVYTTDLSIFKEKEVLGLGAEAIYYKPADFRDTVKTIGKILNAGPLRQSA